MGGICDMSKEKQIEFEMAEMLEIIEKAREVYANDVTDHTENEYIREGLLNAGYRKQSEVAREIFEEIEFDIHQLMFEREEHRATAIEGVIAELKKKYTEEQE
jgi:hypothetical protein